MSRNSPVDDFSNPAITNRPGQQQQQQQEGDSRSSQYFVVSQDHSSADASADVSGHLAGGHFRSLQQQRRSNSNSPANNSLAGDSLMDNGALPRLKRPGASGANSMSTSGGALSDDESDKSGHTAPRVAEFARQQQEYGGPRESLGSTPLHKTAGKPSFQQQLQQPQHQQQQLPAVRGSAPSAHSAAPAPAAANTIQSSASSFMTDSSSPNSSFPGLGTNRDCSGVTHATKSSAPLPMESTQPNVITAGMLPAEGAGRSAAAAAAAAASGDEDEIRSNHSHGSHQSSHQGTNSTGSGDGEEEDLLLSAIIDIVRKGRKRQQEEERAAAAAGRGRGSRGTSVGNSPATLALEGSGDAAPKTALQQNLVPGSPNSPNIVSSPGTNHQALISYCKSLQMQAYGDLEGKSSRALLLADPQKSHILWTNEAAQRLFGRLDLVGSDLESLMPPQLAERHAGIISSYVERYKAEYKKTGQPTDSRLLDVVPPRRLPVVRKVNGRDTIVHVDAWVRSMRISGEQLTEPARIMALEAVEVEQAHRDTEEARIFKAALQNVSDGIVIADTEGRIQWMNCSMEKLCGYPLAAVLAVRGTVNLFLPDSITPQQHEGFLQHYRQKRAASCESQTAESKEVVVNRRVTMRTALPPFKEDIILRVEANYNKLVAYIRSTSEFIPRDEFETERLKLLLPASIVKMLRGADTSLDITSHFWELDNKSVLFTDLEGFSEWSRNRSAHQVHSRMQNMFAEFEDIIRSFGGELISRIGDACLVVFGLSGEERHHARYAVACAVELQRFAIESDNDYSIRIGIESGHIGAGIYGSSKGRPSVDCWGATVNTAKRMESAGVPGAIHISKSVVQALGHKMAGPIHQIVQPHRIEGAKGVPDSDTFLLPVRGPPGSGQQHAVVLPEKFVQMVNQQRGKYSRWKLQAEETERRLAELQKASRQ